MSVDVGRQLQDEVDWDHAAVLLICPDALIRHLAIRILTRLQDNGFEPFYHRLVQVTPDGIDHLYQATVIETWETKLYRLLLSLYRLGPCLFVLLKDAGHRDETMHDRLKRLKGPSDPAEAQPGTIRRDFAAINMILHLLHTSDSPQESRNNADYLLGKSSIHPIEDRTGTLWQQPSSVFDFCRVLALGSAAETRGFSDVLVAFRAKLCARLWDDLLPSGRSLIREWANSHGKALARVGAGKEIVGHMRHREHPLVAALECEFRPGYPGIDLETMLPRLSGEGVLVDRWEALVLSSSSVCAPTETQS